MKFEKHPMAAAMDWFKDTQEFKSSSIASTLLSNEANTYLENRLLEAFRQGWNACEVATKPQPKKGGGE